MDVAVELDQRCTAIGGDGLDDFDGIGVQCSADHRHARLDDASFLSRDFGDRVS